MDLFRDFFLPLFLIFSLKIHSISAANDTIDSSHTITDGETFVSSGGMFELGFFSTRNSSNRYVGIWYKNITVRTYVWVANRQSPLMTKSGVLKVTQPGILALFNDSNGTIIWSSNATRTVGTPAAQLLDTGNLVVKDANDDRPENFVWQSFDYPSDTYLPSMSFGWNYVTGVETYLRSWRSSDDPGLGDFTAHLDPTGYPQIVIRRGEAIRYRFGPWNGVQWSGAAENSNDRIYRLSLVMNKNEVKYREDIVERSLVTKITLNPNGVSPRSTWNYRTQTWNVYSNIPVDSCDSYNMCGAYGSCTVGNSPPCGCLERFVPKDHDSWSRTDWSSGCVRRTPLNCPEDVFLKYSGIKLPDSRYASFNDQSLMLADCKEECTGNCSCMAYTQLNISGSGRGCLFYHGDLIDIRSLSTGGQDLYIRMASSEREKVADSEGRKKVLLIASFTSVAGVVLVCLILVLVCTWKRKKELRKRKAGPFSGSHGEEPELPFFILSRITKATDNFAIINKLGQGGFGPVYKGMLEDGREIAAKCLSKTSLQGVDELKNEVILIAKLQHRNLVRLLGCTIEGDVNMLIYEYMPNNSLDLILFDETKSKLLDWQKRFNIINGIAKDYCIFIKIRG